MKSYPTERPLGLPSARGRPAAGFRSVSGEAAPGQAGETARAGPSASRLFGPPLSSGPAPSGPRWAPSGAGSGVRRSGFPKGRPGAEGMGCCGRVVPRAGVGGLEGKS